jgi:hypothetical protein
MAITRLSLDGYAARRAGSFAGKTPDVGTSIGEEAMGTQKENWIVRMRLLRMRIIIPIAFFLALSVGWVSAQEQSCRPDQMFTEIVKGDRENSQFTLAHAMSQLETAKVELEAVKRELEEMKKKEGKNEKTDK